MEVHLDLAAAQAAHLRFMAESFVSKVEHAPNGTFVMSNIITDSFWSYATHHIGSQETLESFIKTVTERFKSKRRNPCVLINPERDLVLAAALEQAGFERVYEDAWMFYQGARSINPPGSADISICRTQAQFDVFLEVFFSAYSGASPDEPYGALPPEYGLAFQKSFDRRREHGLQHFVLRVDGEPAGVAMLGLEGQVAGFYALGIKPKFRKRGLAQQLTLHRLSVALQHGAKTIFLQTEAGSYNERLFSKFGFSTKARSIAYAMKLYESART